MNSKYPLIADGKWRVIHTMVMPFLLFLWYDSEIPPQNDQIIPRSTGSGTLQIQLLVGQAEARSIREPGNDHI